MQTWRVDGAGRQCHKTVAELKGLFGRQRASTNLADAIKRYVSERARGGSSWCLLSHCPEGSDNLGVGDLIEDHIVGTDRTERHLGFDADDGIGQRP